MKTTFISATLAAIAYCHEQASWYTTHSMTVEDAAAGSTERQYALSVPSSYDPTLSTPLLMYFHGQGDEWPSEYTNYHSLGEQHNFISVYPRGYGDFGGQDQEDYITWNTGLLDNGIEQADDTCFEGTEPTCYDSCSVCSRCSWSTCVNDVQFIEELIAKLSQEYTINPDAVFVTGSSNGGMFTHYFASQKPELVRAVMPIFGLPLVGQMNVPKALSTVPILQMHDRFDTVIPWEGGMTYDGWIYESMTTVMAVWARTHKCESSVKLKGVNTPYDGGLKDIRCMEYHQCQGGRVMNCMYDGQHGAWPHNIEKLTWWFFSQYLDLQEANEGDDQFLQ